jgi:hypothetical protein
LKLMTETEQKANRKIAEAERKREREIEELD